MAQKIQLRRDTTANWTAANPILALAEIGVETDTTPVKLKIGNGSSAWNSLPYLVTSATVVNGSVTNANLTDVSTATFKARVTAGIGSPEDINGTQATSLLNVVTSALKGLAPASGGGTANFLRADGTWAAPVANIGLPAVTKTTTTSTLSQADSGTTALYTNAALVTITIPTGLTIGSYFVLVSLGVGGLTIGTTTGLTFANNYTPKKSITQGESLYVEVTETNTITIIGGTAL